jgi:hypothetical protein
MRADNGKIRQLLIARELCAELKQRVFYFETAFVTLLEQCYMRTIR